jgi:Outer membrane protein beta-barrel domain
VNSFWRVVATVVGVAMTAQVLAATENTAAPDTDAERSWWWLGAGIGAVQLDYGSAAASGDTGFAMTFEGGVHISQHWGLGVEAALYSTGSNCKYCGPASSNLNVGFDHFFLVGEFRPGDSGWRLRVGAGVSDTWLVDGSYNSTTVSAFGAGVSAGYQWRLPTATPMSLGVRLSGETAHFPARHSLEVASLQYSAVTLTMQLSLD